MRPKANYVNIGKGTKQKQLSVEWTKASQKFSKNLLSMASQIDLTIREYIDEQDLYIGDAYLYFDDESLMNLEFTRIDGPLSLSKLLLEKKYAIQIGRPAHSLIPLPDMTIDKKPKSYDHDSGLCYTVFQIFHFLWN